MSATSSVQTTTTTSTTTEATTATTEPHDEESSDDDEEENKKLTPQQKKKNEEQAKKDEKDRKEKEKKEQKIRFREEIRRRSHWPWEEEKTQKNEEEKKEKKDREEIVKNELEKWSQIHGAKSPEWLRVRKDFDSEDAEKARKAARNKKVDNGPTKHPRFINKNHPAYKQYVEPWYKWAEGENEILYWKELHDDFREGEINPVTGKMVTATKHKNWEDEEDGKDYPGDEFYREDFEYNRKTDVYRIADAKDTDCKCSDKKKEEARKAGIENCDCGVVCHCFECECYTCAPCPCFEHSFEGKQKEANERIKNLPGYICPCYECICIKHGENLCEGYMVIDEEKTQKKKRMMRRRSNRRLRQREKKGKAKKKKASAPVYKKVLCPCIPRRKRNRQGTALLKFWEVVRKVDLKQVENKELGGIIDVEEQGFMNYYLKNAKERAELPLTDKQKKTYEYLVKELETKIKALGDPDVADAGKKFDAGKKVFLQGVKDGSLPCSCRYLHKCEPEFTPNCRRCKCHEREPDQPDCLCGGSEDCNCEKFDPTGKVEEPCECLYNCFCVWKPGDSTGNYEFMDLLRIREYKWTEYVENCLTNPNATSDEKEEAKKSCKDAPHAMHAIHKAAEMGHHKCVAALLDNKDNIDHAAEDFKTALYVAAEVGKLSVVQELIDRKADLNKHNWLDKTPLYIAARWNHPKCVKALIDANANLNKPDCDNNSPLADAAFYGHEECCRLLCDAKCKINMANKYGQTPMYMAASHNRHETVKMLIDHNSNLNQINKEERMPLSMARWCERTETIAHLEEAKAEVEEDPIRASRTRRYRERFFYVHTYEEVHKFFEDNDWDVIQTLQKMKDKLYEGLYKELYANSYEGPLNEDGGPVQWKDKDGKSWAEDNPECKEILRNKDWFIDECKEQLTCEECKGEGMDFHRKPCVYCQDVTDKKVRCRKCKGKGKKFYCVFDCDQCRGDWGNCKLKEKCPGWGTGSQKSRDLDEWKDYEQAGRDDKDGKKGGDATYMWMDCRRCKGIKFEVVLQTENQKKKADQIVADKKKARKRAKFDAKQKEAQAKKDAEQKKEDEARNMEKKENDD